MALKRLHRKGRGFIDIKIRIIILGYLLSELLIGIVSVLVADYLMN